MLFVFASRVLPSSGSDLKIPDNRNSKSNQLAHLVGPARSTSMVAKRSGTQTVSEDNPPPACDNEQGKAPMDDPTFTDQSEDDYISESLSGHSSLPPPPLPREERRVQQTGEGMSRRTVSTSPSYSTAPLTA